MPDFVIRPAVASDAALVLTLLAELAAYEKLLDKFTVTAADIVRDFFGAQAAARCALGFVGEEPVGLITWYGTYNSFAAVRGLFLEDLFVRPGWRGKGYGKAFLSYLTAEAAASGARRVEWSVLEWNKPSIDFYDGIGARPVEGWSIYRLEGEAMKKLGEA